MLNQQIESLITDISKVLPGGLQQAREELRENLRAALTASLSKLELVTREEFDIQAALLERSRAKLEQLEQKLQELERQLETKG